MGTGQYSGGYFFQKIIFLLKICLDKSFRLYIFKALQIGELRLFIGLKIIQAQVAQSVEHVLGKDEVTGSNPVLGC